MAVGAGAVGVGLTTRVEVGNAVGGVAVVGVGVATKVIRSLAWTVASMSGVATGGMFGSAALTAASTVAPMSGVGTGLLVGCAEVHPNTTATNNTEA